MANTANNKISTIVGSQLPAFVQDDYQTFVAFLQAYYEYLEQEGKLVWAQDKLAESFDIDSTLDAFLDKFKDQYLRQFPADILADKTLLIKNIKQFYRSKGSEKSLKFLFRALFGEDITVVYPNRSILRVSDGKWIKEQALRITGDVLNIYTGDGNTKSYIITDEVNSKANLFITINDVEINQNNYSLVGREVTLTSNVANGDILSISIDGGDYNRFTGTQVFGEDSGASAIVEKYKRVYDKGEFYNELTITGLTKNFEIGEIAYTNYIDDATNTAIKLAVPITSSVIDVNIVDGGAFYNVGDPLIFTSNSGSGAQAFVASIFKAGIRSVEVIAKGAGFKSGVMFNIAGGGGTGAAVLLNGVDSSGNVHPNTYNVTSDIINTYANTLISANTYGFPAFANGNVNTLLSQAFTFNHQYGLCGPIDPTEVLIIAEGEGYETPPSITLDSPVFQVNSSNIVMSDFGILGAFKITSAGENYAVGDEIIFTNAPGSTGQDGAAAVTAVSATGGISKIEFQFPRIGGTVNIIANSNVVFGTSTDFANNITANATIIVNNEIRIVQTVTNTNNMIVTVPWTHSASNKKLGVKGRNFIGGSGYHSSALPSVTIQSGSGSNANISVVAVIGDGEQVQVGSLQPVGRIRTITVTQGGRNYIEAPNVDLSQSGDGTATAEAQIAGGLFEYPGVYKNEDGFPSGSSKIHNRDFYQFYSYVIKSSKTLDKYEATLKQLIHPIGMKYFAEVVSTPTTVTANVSMSAYEIAMDYKFVRIMLSGSATTSKRKSYLVVPGRFTIGGNAGVYKVKNWTVNLNSHKISGTHGPAGTTDYFFYAPLANSLLLSEGTGLPTYSRAGSNTATFVDYESLVRKVLPGEARFVGARRVHNLIISSELDSSYRSKPNTTTAQISTDKPSVCSQAVRVTVTSNTTWAVQKTCAAAYQASLLPGPRTGSLYLKGEGSSIGRTVRFSVTDGGGTGADNTTSIILTSDWQRVHAISATSWTGSDAVIQVWHGAANTVANNETFLISGWQLENTLGRSNRTPSEYVSVGQLSSPYHGANVDGVKYFDTFNGNHVPNTAYGLMIDASGEKLPENGIKYAEFDGVLGSTFYTPDSPANSITGDLDVRFKLAFDHINPGVLQMIVSKASDSNGTYSFYIAQHNNSAAFRYMWHSGTPAGSGGQNIRDLSFAGIPQLVSGVPCWIRIHHDVDAGGNTSQIHLYYSNDYNPKTNTGGWILSSTTNVAGSTQIQDTSQRIEIGSKNNAGLEPFRGKIFHLEAWNGATGTKAYEFDPNSHTTSNTWIASTGETWTRQGSGVYFGNLQRPLGYLAEQQSKNLTLRSDDFGNTWSAIGTPILSTTFPFLLGDVSLAMIGDDDSGVLEGYSQTISFTGNGPKALSFIFARSTSTSTAIRFRDATALVDKVMAVITWSNSDPILTVTAGKLLGLDPLANSAFRARFTTDNVIAGNSNQLTIYPATTSGFISTMTGNVFIGAIQCEDNHFPTSYIPNLGVANTRPADILNYPISSANATHGKITAEVTAKWSNANLSSTVVDIGNNRSFSVPNTSANLSLSDGTVRGGRPFVPSYNVLSQVEAVYLGSPNNTIRIAQNKNYQGATFDGNMDLGANIHVGTANGGANAWNGTIKNLRLWGGRFNDNTYRGLEFDAPLLVSLVPNTSYSQATFLRSGGYEAYVEDWERRLVKARAGEARFYGVRRVQNILLAPESNSGWTLANAGTLSFAPNTSFGFTAPDGTNTAFRVQATVGAGDSANQSYVNLMHPGAFSGRTYMRSIWVKSNNGASQNVLLGIVGSNWPNQLVTTSWQRFAKAGNIDTGTDLVVGCRGGSSDASIDVLIWHPQIEDITGQTFQHPSEYVSNGVLTTATNFHGANVDGVKYFSSPNRNITYANGVVLESSSINAPLKWLELPGLTNNFANTPDAANNRIAGSMDVDIHAALAWSNTSQMMFVAKDDGTAGNRMFTFYKSTGNRLAVDLFDTAGTVRGTTATAALPFADNTSGWIRFKLDWNLTATCNVTFYYGYDGNSWTELGTMQTFSNTGLGLANNAVAPLSIGVRNRSIGNDSPLPPFSKIYRMRIYNGDRSNNVLLVDFNAARANVGWSTASMATGETWTLHSNTSFSTNAHFREAFVMNANNDYFSQVMMGYFTEGDVLNYLPLSADPGNTTVWLSNNAFDQNDLYFPLEANLTMVRGNTTGMSFARPNATATIEDWESHIRPTKVNEVRFRGSRRVENLINVSSENLTTSAWTINGGTRSFGNTDPFGGSNATSITSVAAADNYLFNRITRTAGYWGAKRLAFSFWARTTSGTLDLPVLLDGDSAQFAISPSVTKVPLTTTWQRFGLVGIIPSSFGGSDVRAGFGGFSTWTTANTVELYGLQVEDTTGSVIAFPAEYVSNGVFSAPYHGVNVDGVKYFTFPTSSVISNTGIVTSNPNVSQRLAWAEFPGKVGNYINTPNSALASSITATGVMDIKWFGTVDLTSGSNTRTLIAKAHNTNGLSWTFSRVGSNQLRLSWTTQDDTTWTATSNSVVSSIYTNTAIHFRCTHVANNGAGGANTDFYYGFDGNTWTQIGSVVTAVTNTIIKVTPVDVTIGATTDGTLAPHEGKVYRVTVANTIGGNPCLSFDASRAAAGAGNVTSETGETWTLNSNTAFFTPNVAIRDAFVANTGPYSTPILGYLSESRSNNIVIGSQDFGNGWGIIAGTPSRTAAAKRLGVLSLDLLSDANTSVAEGYSQNILFTANGNVAFSFFIAQGTASNNFVRLFDNSLTVLKFKCHIGWNANGYPLVTMGPGELHAVERFANGIYRICGVTTSPIVRTSVNTLLIAPGARSLTEFGLDGSLTGSTYFGGFQLEERNTVTSYIPTTSLATVRDADILTITSAGHYQANAGALYAEVTAPTPAKGWIVGMSSGNGSILAKSSAASNTALELNDGTSNSQTSFVNWANLVRASASWSPVRKRASINGSANIADTAYDGSFDDANTLYIGHLESSNSLNGTIKNLRMWKRTLANTDLIAYGTAAFSNLVVTTSSTIIAPNGTTNTRIVTDTSNAVTSCLMVDANTMGTVLTGTTIQFIPSIYIRKTPGTNTHCALAQRYFGANTEQFHGVVFNPATGRYVTDIFGANTRVGADPIITDHGQWWRISFVGASVNSNNHNVLRYEFYPAWNNTGSANADPTTTGSQTIWAPQHESATTGTGFGFRSARMPIETTNSAIMQSGWKFRDLLTYSGGANAHWISARGTVHYEISTIPQDGGFLMNGVGDTSAGPVMANKNTQNRDTAKALGVWSLSGGLNLFNGTAWVSNNIMQSVSATWDKQANVLALYVNGGGSHDTKTHANAFTLTGTYITIGYGDSIGSPLFGAMRGVKLYRNALTSPQMALLANPDGIGNATVSFDFSQNTVVSQTGNITPTFVRTSTGTRTGPTGLIEVMSANTPRYDFNPITGTHRGLLIEQSSTNIQTWSADLSQSSYGVAGASVTANAATAPDGSNSGWKLVENSSAVAHRITSNIPLSNTTTYTISVFVKASERSYVALNFTNLAAGMTFFDLNNGAILNRQAGVLAASIDPAGSGWYRISATATTTSTGQFADLLLSDASQNFTYTGDGSSGMFVWGFQIEQTSFPTSYIPTGSASATRATDTLSFALGSWFSSHEGSVIFTGTTHHPNNNISSTLAESFWSFQNTTSNIIQVRYSGNNVIGAGVNTAAAVQCFVTQTPSSGTLGNLEAKKVGFVWANNNFSIKGAFNSNTYSTDIAGVLPQGLTTGVIGSGSSQFNGWIKKWSYYDRCLPQGIIDNLDTFYP
jgi:hypothetical protein